jgi:hypothetical protein
MHHRPAEDDEPLVDTTEAIQLHSKKTERLQRKQLRKSKDLATNRRPTNLLDLPTEIQLEILCHLRPSDIFRVSRSSQTLQHLIAHHNDFIAQNIIDCRYPILAKCFPKPVPLAQVDPKLHPVLLSEKRQAMLNIHKKPYQHIRAPDQNQTCTCLTCILAWNNLCLIVDLAHWQKDLNERKPIPMLPRGESPQWNTDLVDGNAAVVEQAIKSPLWYARILEHHLSTTTQTLTRQYKHTKNSKPPFGLTARDVTSETDAFASREGPESFEFQYHRDNYYALTSYLPNRRFDKPSMTWLYYPADQHAKDLEWVRQNDKNEKNHSNVQRMILLLRAWKD